MFTGIVQKTSVVKDAKRIGSSLQAEVAIPAGWKLSNGQSIAIDGVCVTVTGAKRGTFSFECMPVTLKKTTARVWEKGRVVNLERALRQKDLLDGHLIQGHVEGRGRIAKVTEDGRSKHVTIALPASLIRSVSLHGSIAINGVSLTVSHTRGSAVTLSLIPYTLAHTNLGSLAKGDEVNVETDFLARHMKRGRVTGNASRRAK